MIKISQLHKRCAMHEIEYALEFRQHVVSPAPEQLIYIDNGAPVLGIAHLDYVARPENFSIRGRGKRMSVQSGQLDDRLGAYVILDLLPSLGINTDILLTTNEEVGRSTVQLFKPDRQYNWAFSFDREGIDVVLYQYSESDELVGALAGHGFPLSYGSYSDIVDLDAGCAAFNVGTGMIGGHSSRSLVPIASLAYQVRMFRRFYKQYAHRHFEFDNTTYGYDFYGYGLEFSQDEDFCQDCPGPAVTCKACSHLGSCPGCLRERGTAQEGICPDCGCDTFIYHEDLAACYDCGRIIHR